MVGPYPSAKEIRNATGYFLITDIEPGVYDIILAGPGFVRRVLPGQEVKPGRVTDLGVIDVDRGRTIRGKVISQTGIPQREAEVRLESHIDMRADTDALTGFASGSQVTRTNDAGEYEFHNVPDSFVTSEIRTSARYDGKVSGPFPVADGLVLILLPTGSLLGTIGNFGSLSNEEVSIVCRLGGGDPRFVATPDEHGEFKIPELPVGSYEIEVLSDHVLIRTTATINDGQETQLRLVLP